MLQSPFKLYQQKGKNIELVWLGLNVVCTHLRYLPLLWPVRQFGDALEPNAVKLVASIQRP